MATTKPTRRRPLKDRCCLTCGAPLADVSRRTCPDCQRKGRRDRGNRWRRAHLAAFNANARRRWQRDKDALNRKQRAYRLRRKLAGHRVPLLSAPARAQRREHDRRSASVWASKQKWRRAHAALVREWRRSAEARRRARQKGAAVEPVSPQAIYDRDEGRCWLCKKAVSRDQMSLDHVIPIAKGGDHTPRNIRLCHLRCNVRKSANVLTLF